MKLRNHYFILRHGESLKNIKHFESSWPEKTRVPLTEKGKKQTELAARRLENKKIDLIFTSDLLRTRQTAGIVARQLDLKSIPDKRLREVGLGIFNGKPANEFRDFWNQGKRLSLPEHYKKRFTLSLPGGETYKEVESRLADFIKEMENKYRGKNILIVSHERPITLFEKVVKKCPLNKFVKIIIERKEIKTGEVRKI